MKIDIVRRKVDIAENQINVIIESNENNPYTEDFTNYVKRFNKTNNIIESDSQYNKVIVIDGERIKVIDKREIICFFSKNKSNYCRTKDNVYRVRSSLYELENMNTFFVRISKKCIANTNQVSHFEMNAVGKMVVVFNDKTEEKISRRRIKKIEKYLDERRI